MIERIMPTWRMANLLTFVICAAMMGYALYAEHVLELFPCPLCVFQRIAVIGLGAFSLLAALHNPRGGGRYVYTLLSLVAAGFGIAIAGRHVWLQNLPPDQVPSCGGASLDYMLDTLPLLEVFNKVLTASGECAEVTWRFATLSMPAWVLIGLIALALWVLLSAFAAKPARTG
ncbi:MAG: disulfide bond formation protein B [Pseudomonadota bacterium]